MTKIGIDARSIANRQKSGVEGYIADLLQHLPEQNNAINFYYFVDVRTRNIPRHPQNVHYIRIPFSGDKWFWRALTWYCRLNKLDLFHFPIAIIPERFPAKAVVTIYDLASEVYPQFYTQSELDIHRKLVKHSVHDLASGILAISESTKQDLLRYYQADPTNIYVTHLSPNVQTIKTNRTSPYSFPYLLCIGNVQPRKNYVGAIKALELLKQGDLHLVIAGKFQDAGELARIQDKVQTSGLGDRVHITGYVDQTRLHNLLAHARALLFVPFYEGFGIPVLESFSFGVPVISSNTSSLPEVAQDAAQYCDPNDPASIAHAIAAVVSDRKHSQELVNQGHRRLLELKKVSLAESTLKAYQAIINRAS